MAYKRYYSEWTDENSWAYTLYIIPSNANGNPLFPNDAPSFDANFTAVKLPDDFIKRDMKLSTELGEIPVGIVSQTLEMTLNLGALQGTTDYDDLRGQLLQGSSSAGMNYNASGVKCNSDSRYAFNQYTDIFGKNYTYGVGGYQKFNVFILMVNDGFGIRPIFIGAQKYAAENELTVNKLSEILAYKIECFDVMRCIGEAISHDAFMLFMTEGMLVPPASIDYGDGISQLSSVSMNQITLYRDLYTDSKSNVRMGSDLVGGGLALKTSTFERMRTLMQDLFTRYMRGLTWNLNSSISLPVPFARAWTFYKQRNKHGSIPTDAVLKPAYVSEIWQIPDGRETKTPKLLGGALYDPTALGKVKNGYEILSLIVENSLEIYRLSYSHSALSGWFSASYTADYLRPDVASGITFGVSNTYGDVKFKLFSETVKSAKASCSTLQGEKDSKSFPYEEQGTSGDNGKDLEIVFHNLPSATNRKGNSAIRYAINAGMIITVDNLFGTAKKVDSTCQYKYSSTDAVKLQYDDVPASGENMPEYKDDKYSVAMIVEQQTAGVPYTIAYSLVKALGSARETELTFKTKHMNCDPDDVGKTCTINMNAMNPLITKIYNANTGTAVITKHELDIFSGSVDITARMYQ